VQVRSQNLDVRGNSMAGTSTPMRKTVSRHGVTVALQEHGAQGTIKMVSRGGWRKRSALYLGQAVAEQVTNLIPRQKEDPCALLLSCEQRVRFESFAARRRRSCQQRAKVLHVSGGRWPSPFLLAVPRLADPCDGETIRSISLG